MPLAVMVQSVLEHLHPDARAHVHVLDGGIAPQHRAALTKAWSRSGAVASWFPVSTADFAGAPLWGRMSAATYYRLAVTDLLPPSEHRAIWLDCDLIATADISRIWAMDLGDRHLLAVQDGLVPLVSSRFGIHAHRQLGIPDTAKYFNAGVMLLDLDRWRQDKVTSRALEYVKRHCDSVFFWDQEGLNAVLAGRWGELDPRWNYNASVSRPQPRGSDDPWIIHFAGTLKPWRFRSRDPRRALFYRYLDRTIWAGWRPPRTWSGLIMRAYESPTVRAAMRPAERWRMHLVRARSRRAVTGAVGQRS